MKKKLKIAIFHNLPSGGAVKALQDNCIYLRKKGHEIDVFVPETANETFAPLKNIVDNYYIYPIKKSKLRKIILKVIGIVPKINIDRNSRGFIKYKDFENTQKQIAQDINERDYDIVFSEQDSLFTMSPAFLKYVQKPLVYYCQQPFRNDEMILKKFNTKNSFIDKLSDQINKKYIDLDVEHAQFCDNILANSYFSHETILRKYGMNSQVSYLGINTLIFKPLNSKRKNFILSVGNINPQKGFDFIIKSIGKVNENIRPSLKIVGYGSNENYLNYLKNLANMNKVNLEILENISYDELLKIYNEAKLFAFGSYLEPFGLVSLESLACGTPVITVKEGGIKEIVKHMENGLLLDRDEKTFANGITELLTNEKLWAKFSKNGPEYVNKYWSLDNAGENLLNHFYRVLDENK